MKTSRSFKSLSLAILTLALVQGVSTARADMRTPRALVCSVEVLTLNSSGPGPVPGPGNGGQSVVKFTLRDEFKVNPRIDPRNPSAMILSDLGGVGSVQILSGQSPGHEGLISIRFKGGDALAKDNLLVNLNQFASTGNSSVWKTANLNCSLR